MIRDVRWATFLGVAIAGANPAWSQSIDPQLLMDYMLRQRIEESAVRHQNEMMRLEIERQERAAQLRYRQASDREISAEMVRYCPPAGEPPCRQQPPQVLIQEAARRGLIKLAPTSRPRVDCLGVADPDGPLSLSCY